MQIAVGPPTVAATARISIISPCSAYSRRLLEDYKVSVAVMSDQIDRQAYTGYSAPNDHQGGFSVGFVGKG